MNKAQKWHEFLSSFGLTAYEESAVPSGDNAPDFPYLTYQYASDGFGNTVMLNADLWYRSPSWTDANDKADIISEHVSSAGIVLRTDNGAIWVRRGSPFAQSMGDPDDDLIRRKHLIFEVEDFSNS